MRGNRVNLLCNFSTVRRTGMVFLETEVPVWFIPVQRSAGMAYRLMPSHFKHWLRRVTPANPHLAKAIGLLCLYLVGLMVIVWVSYGYGYTHRLGLSFKLRVTRCGNFHSREEKFDLDSQREWELKWAATGMGGMEMKNHFPQTSNLNKKTSTCGNTSLDHTSPDCWWWPCLLSVPILMLFLHRV